MHAAALKSALELGDRIVMTEYAIYLARAGE
jgi:hypothetical protein